MDLPKDRNWKRLLAIGTLILAGEAIFVLPFVLARVFRPTFLAVFEINNFQLGTYFSGYGIVATVSYLFGGPLADKFNTSRLMSFALVATSAGGFFLATIPDPNGMKLLYLYWGMTTILLFWAALMRTTRIWGGEEQHGLAFGLLDGGRGVVSATTGTIGIIVMSIFLPTDIDSTTIEMRSDAFGNVILVTSGFVLAMAGLVYIVLPTTETGSQEKTSAVTIEKVKEVAQYPLVWLQAVIILCAYSGYKITDDFSLLASDLLGYNDIDAAKVGTLSLWIRPIAAVGAGLLADRISASKMIVVCLSLMLIGGLTIGLGISAASIEILVFIAILTTTLGVFAMRGLYFAIMGEANIPWHVTGTAVGIASILGYTPDIYMGPLMGYLLDANPGATGHQHVFLLLAGFSTLGLIATLLFRKQSKRHG